MSKLPTGWQSCGINEIARIVSGATPKTETPEYWDGDILWATPKDLGQLSKIELSDTERKISKAGYDSCSTTLLPIGSVLLTSRAPIGHLAINNKPMCTNQGFKSLIPNDRIESRYLYWVLKKYVPELQNMGRGCTFDEISKRQVESFQIPVPPLQEQRRIVSRIEELTNRADEARRLILEKEAEFDILIRAIYQRMIESADWQPLKQVANLVRRKIDMKPDEKYEEMGIRSFGKGTFKKPVLTGEQVGGKHIYRIHEGDLVFNNVFAWEGAIAVAQPEDHGRVGSHRFITYSPHKGKATAEFLCHHFLSEQGLEAIGAASPGSAGRNRTLGLAKLDTIKVPAPQYQEQVRFEALAKHRRQIQRESTAIDSELKTLQSAIIAKAFRGEL